MKNNQKPRRYGSRVGLPAHFDGMYFVQLRLSLSNKEVKTAPPHP